MLEFLLAYDWLLSKSTACGACCRQRFAVRLNQLLLGFLQSPGHRWVDVQLLESNAWQWCGESRWLVRCRAVPSRWDTFWCTIAWPRLNSAKGGKIRGIDDHTACTCSIACLDDARFYWFELNDIEDISCLHCTKSSITIQQRRLGKKEWEIFLWPIKPTSPYSLTKALISIFLNLLCKDLLLNAESRYTSFCYSYPKSAKIGFFHALHNWRWRSSQ